MSWMAWPSVIPSFTIRRFSSAKGISRLFDAWTVATNSSRRRNPPAAAAQIGAARQSATKTIGKHEVALEFFLHGCRNRLGRSALDGHGLRRTDYALTRGDRRSHHEDRSRYRKRQN